MSGEKRYQITFRRTEELTVEIEAESEFEACSEAIELVSSRGDGQIIAPGISMPETIDHNVTEWSVYTVAATSRS